jgi:hypothetical protein
MTFLNPAILFGLLAASIPVILHFLNLRKLKKVEFSTLIFLKELQKTKIRRIKLKQWLILLLRLLIIIMLVLAFARPAIKTGFAGYTAAKTTAVFIIDNTFSMSIVANEGSYLNKSKQIARELLNNFKGGDEIAVVPIVTEENWEAKPKTDFSIVQKEIEEIRISYVRKTLYDAIINAGRILFESKNFNKEVYLLTDLQSGSFSKMKESLSSLTGLFQNVKFFVVNFQKKPSLNIGVDSVKLNTQIFEKNKPLFFQVSVKNYSESNLESSVVSLYINNKRSAQQSITLSGSESKQIFFETTLTDTGLVNVGVEIEDDDVVSDNKRVTSFYAPDKIKLLLLYNSFNDLKFLNLVFNSQLISALEVTEAKLPQLHRQILKRFNVIVLIGTPDESGTDKLKNYIDDGGGVLFFPESNADLNSIKNFFNKLKLPSPMGFTGKINSPDLPAQFDKVDFKHPLFANLFEDKSKTKIESPEIYYYMKIIPEPDGKNIISMFDKSAFLSEYKSGAGKLLVFNTSPVLSWNNLPLKSIFPALLSKSIFYLSSQFKESETNYCGDEIFIKVPSSRQIKIVYPNDVSEIINTDSLLNKNYFRFANTQLPGTYRFYSGGELIDYFSINHDPDESIINYNSISDLENFLEKAGFDGSFFTLDDNRKISDQIYNSRFGTELWKYFIIAALLFALMEMIVARSSKKDAEQFVN